MRLDNNLSTVIFDYAKETSTILDALKNSICRYADESEEGQIVNELLELLSIADKKLQLEETIGRQYDQERRALERELWDVKMEYEYHESEKENKYSDPH